MHNPLFARALRIVVFALLLTSAAVAIVLSERMWQLWGLGELPTWAPIGAPVCFATFMFFFGLDRLVAVRRGQEAPARGIMQVAAAFLLLTLLLPQQALEMHRASHRHDLDPTVAALNPPPIAPATLLLQHSDDAVREATCALLAGETLGLPHPMPPGHPLEALRDLLHELTENDASPEVRCACAEALGHLAPMDEEDAREACSPSLRQLQDDRGPLSDDGDDDSADGIGPVGDKGSPLVPGPVDSL